MNWFKALNNALYYIENHIEENLNTEDIAAIAMCSKDHFLRTFSMLTDITLGEYIRTRRLSLAAYELLSRNSKVIDIALKYGYETPEAFSKAFKRFHGISPSMVKKDCSVLKAVPPLSFQITIKGAERMDYQIIKKESFELVGLSRRFTTMNQENYKQIPMFWKELCDNGISAKMHNQADIVYGVCYDARMEESEFSYLIGIRGNAIEGVDSVDVITVPATTWAVFESVGPMPHAIQNVWKQIYSEWFPATKYEHAGTAELEVYLPGNPDTEDYRCQVWIPIVEKEA